MENRETGLEGLEIRNFRPEDYQKIKGNLIEAGLYYEPTDSEKHFIAKHTKDPESILVAEYNGQVIGSALFTEDGWIAFGFRFAVKPEFQNRGAAGKLLERMRRIAKERGHTKLHIFVEAEKEGLQEMWQRKGFEEGSLYKWMELDLGK